jgi:hypothetical protein
MSALDKMIDAVTPPESDEKRAEAHAKARAAASPGDWLSMILDHHEQLEAAFAMARAAQSAEARKTALKELATLLTGHSIAEEGVIYPALAAVGKGGDADMAYTQQVAAKLQAAALETMDPESEDFVDKLGHLEGAVLHHAFKEESDWLLELKQHAAPEEQARIGRRYKEEFERYMGAGADTLSARTLGEPRSFESRPPV